MEQQQVVEQNSILISQELKSKAISLGLCEKWTKEWENEDLDSLCEKYIRGIDFCIENNYPDNNYIKSKFGEIASKHNIFVDEIFSIENAKKVVSNGICVGDAVYDNFNVGRIYLRHNSTLSIKAKGNAKVFISIYDDAILNVETSDNAKVYIYKYSGKINKKGENIWVRTNHS